MQLRARSPGEMFNFSRSLPVSAKETPHVTRRPRDYHEIATSHSSSRIVPWGRGWGTSYDLHIGYVLRERPPFSTQHFRSGAYTLKTEMLNWHLKGPREWPLFLHVVFNILSSCMDPAFILLDKMLDIACGKIGHSSALLNVNLTFKFLEYSIFTNDKNISFHSMHHHF